MSHCGGGSSLFDDKGCSYGVNLRAGAVHTSVGAIEMIENAFGPALIGQCCLKMRNIWGDEEDSTNEWVWKS
jgi:hypothetical protein